MVVKKALDIRRDAERFQRELARAQHKPGEQGAGPGALPSPEETAREAAELSALADRFSKVEAGVVALRGVLEMKTLEQRVEDTRTAVVSHDLPTASEMVPRFEAAFESTARIFVRTALLRCELKLVELEAIGAELDGPRPHLLAARKAQDAGEWVTAVREGRDAERGLEEVVRTQVTHVLDDAGRMLDSFDEAGADAGEWRPRIQEAWAMLHDGQLEQALDLAVQARQEIMRRRDEQQL